VYRFTGQPLVDVGIATLTAFAGHTRPEQLTGDDLARAADWLASLYASGTLMGNLARGMLVLNSGYFDARRDAYIQRVLLGWQEDAPRLDAVCTFCGAPAAYLANREDVPLFTGRAVINFGPSGRDGQPVCGCCSLALHMLPVGCFKSGRGLVALHSEDPALVLAFARENLRRLQQMLTLHVESLPELRFARTRITELLLQQWARLERRRTQPASLTAYYFSNAGQSPFVEIYRVDACALTFLDAVLHPVDLAVRDAWERAAARAWIAHAKDEGLDALRRNRLYEDFLTLPEGALTFLRRYLLPTGCWPLVELYLRKVLTMRDSDLNLLREVGDRMAAYARQKSQFFYDFSRTHDYVDWRRIVLRAADDSARVTGVPLISFDEFVTLFTFRDGEIWDWRLARDLITLRMIEARAVPETDAPLFDDDLSDLPDEDQA
jgi:CRISPR-associated protein Cst1